MMNRQQKNKQRFQLWRALLSFSLMIVAYVIWMIDGTNVWVFGPIGVAAAILGLIAFPQYTMYKAYRNSSKTDDQIARETLESLQRRK